MHWIAPLLILAGACASGRWVVVRVTAVDGAPLADATVSAVCPPRGSAAKVTGADGVAELRPREGGRCTITATRAEHETRQTDIEACRARATCAPLELRLERE